MTLHASTDPHLYDGSDFEVPEPVSWKQGLRNHCLRLAYSGLGAELLPAFARIKLMRRLGFDVDPSACIWAKCEFRSNEVSIGSAVFVNIGFFHDGSAKLTIGDNVRIGQFVKVITGTHRIGPSLQRCLMEAINAPVSIGSGCWIGAGVTILPGVTIADGCVVGAASTVVRSTEPNGLYVGSPAKRVRSLPA